MPNKTNNVLSFTGTHMQHPKSCVIYADFESLLVPISNTTTSNPDISSTLKLDKHVACGYAYIIVGPDGTSHKPIRVYRGEDAVNHFIIEILKEREELAVILKEIKPMKLTPQEEEAFQQAMECSICHQPLGNQRIREHCHITGVYRGAAHPDCNLNYKQPKSIPVIFHNLQNYDAHHIMTGLGEFQDLNIQVIPNTLEKYISFSIKVTDCPITLNFLDSLHFLPSSLEKLVENLDTDKFNLLNENFKNSSSISILKKKGIYPYSYLKNFNQFNETQLPPKSAFFNSLTEEDITQAEYQHASDVWELFQIKDLGEYHDLYVKTDVLLLADVFENFRQVCLKYYELDPTHVYTAPGLSWQACLKMTNMKLELLTDVDQLLFIEKGVRGGVSQISTRYAKANIPETEEYDNTRPPSYIMYLDANNLYRWSMSQYLPHGGFRWVNPDEITIQQVLNTSDTAPEGYILEVDLEYPHHLHSLHNDYPLCPERLTVTEDMLSSQAKIILGSKTLASSEKLTPNLNDKKHYVLHYRNLKYYIEQGMKLTHTHKILKFNQSAWLEPYITFNTEKRKNSTSTFEKNFFKLLNNSIYGKCIENLRRRKTVEVTNNPIHAEKIIASPKFKNFKIFNENLAALERVKSTIFMNRPVYVGFAILELSKLHMYRFHYGTIKKIYNEKATLLFTDTDSLTYHIHTQNIYTDMQNYEHEFDFSDYPTSHFLHSNTNKKVLGKFKDELNGRRILEFVGLKAKMYSILSEDGEKKRAKGISTRALKKSLTHADYKTSLQQMKTYLTKQTRIGQESHNLFTLQQKKISLSPFDDKRYILDDNIHTLAYGHFEIDKT